VPHFIDTNILLYSISDYPLDLLKRGRAIDILEQEGGAISTQVVQEFYVQATRANRNGAITHDFAVRFILTWARFRTQDTTLALVMSALEIKSRYRLSYWDSAIVAAARALRCDVLYSEDMQHGQVIDGVTITNPFR